MKYLKLILLISILAFAGCSTFEPIMQRGEDVVRSTEDVVRSTDRLARSTERLSDQTAETGRSIKRLKKQRTCVEAKDASAEYNTMVRLVGTDQRHPLKATEYVRFDIPVERFADKHVFTVEMDVYTKDGQYVKTAPQQIENKFNKYELTDSGCGIVYFTSDNQRITGLKKAGEVDLY